MFTTNLKRRQLATENYVDESIDINLPTGSVREVTAGDGLCIVGGGVLTTTGIIALDAELNDLSNVSGTPHASQVLGWNDGTSAWEPMTFLGSGTSSLQWDDITNAQSLTGTSDYIMKVNSDADALEFVPNRLVYGPGIIAGEGLTHTLTSSSNGDVLRIQTDLSELYTTPNSSSDTHMVIVDESNNQRRILFDNISLGSFSNDNNNPYLRSGGISASEPVQFDSATTTFSLTRERYDIDFDVAEELGITGLLPVAYGGTSGSTAEEARENLGLTYNVDIMTHTGPEFIDTMLGNDILIRPNYLQTTNLELVNTGSGYDGGEAYVTMDDGNTFLVDITTGASEELVTVVAQSSSGYNYLDWNTGNTGTVSDGVDGTVNVDPRTGYINFGQTTGHSGYGIGYDGEFWFRGKNDNDWLNTIPFTLQNATNVESNPTSLDPGVILVYDGDDFNFVEMSGDVSINQYGTTSITAGSLDPSLITATHDGGTVVVDRFEFGTLHDITTGSTIQEQLNDKVGISGSLNEGDIAYYNGTSWSALSYPSSTDYVLTSGGVSAPTWNFVSDTYQSNNSYSVGDSIMFLDSDYIGTSPTYYTEMDEILREHCSGTGGMAIPGTVLSTDLAGLPDVSGFNTTDFYLAVNDPSVATPLDERINAGTFLEAGAGTGLTSSGGQIHLDLATDIVPDNDKTNDLGSTTNRWDHVYLQHGNFCPHATLGAYSGTPVAGEMIYVSDDGSGNPYVGVYTTGTGWMKLELTTI